MHKMVHFAMLQPYCSRIQVKTHSTMLAVAPLAPNGWFCANCVSYNNNNNNNNNNNQYIYKQRQSHAMSQRRWLATAVIFRPSDMSLG